MMYTFFFLKLTFWIRGAIFSYVYLALTNRSDSIVELETILLAALSENKITASLLTQLT